MKTKIELLKVINGMVAYYEVKARSKSSHNWKVDLDYVKAIAEMVESVNNDKLFDNVIVKYNRVSGINYIDIGALVEIIGCDYFGGVINMKTNENGYDMKVKSSVLDSYGIPYKYKDINDMVNVEIKSFINNKPHEVKSVSNPVIIIIANKGDFDLRYFSPYKLAKMKAENHPLICDRNKLTKQMVNVDSEYIDTL